MGFWMLSITICSSIYFGFMITVEIIILCKTCMKGIHVGCVCNYFIKKK